MATYSLSVAIPPQGANETPLLALRPDLAIPNVGNGQIDSLDVGTLQVVASGTCWAAR